MNDANTVNTSSSKQWEVLVTMTESARRQLRTKTEEDVLIAIRRHQGKLDGHCWASVNTIATECGISTSTTKRCITSMSDRGIISKLDNGKTLMLRCNIDVKVNFIPAGSFMQNYSASRNETSVTSEYPQSVSSVTPMQTSTFASNGTSGSYMEQNTLQHGSQMTQMGLEMTHSNAFMNDTSSSMTPMSSQMTPMSSQMTPMSSQMTPNSSQMTPNSSSVHGSVSSMHPIGVMDELQNTIYRNTTNKFYLSKSSCACENAKEFIHEDNSSRGEKERYFSDSISQIQNRQDELERRTSSAITELSYTNSSLENLTSTIMELKNTVNSIMRNTCGMTETYPLQPQNKQDEHTTNTNIERVRNGERECRESFQDYRQSEEWPGKHKRFKFAPFSDEEEVKYFAAENGYLVNDWHVRNFFNEVKKRQGTKDQIVNQRAFFLKMCDGWNIQRRNDAIEALEDASRKAKEEEEKARLEREEMERQKSQYYNPFQDEEFMASPEFQDDDLFEFIQRIQFRGFRFNSKEHVFSEYKKYKEYIASEGAN